MSRKRIPSTERRTLILEAARQVFSRHGYDRTRTNQIAQEANISEALIFRHFPTKLALYRGVLRQLFREQDENWQAVGIQEPSAAGLVRTQKAYFRAIVLSPEGKMQAGFRMTLASLLSDGSFASIIYRRSQRRNLRAVEAAFAAAREAGEITGPPAHVGSTTMFTEHVGTMMNAIYGLPPSARPYGLDGEALVRDAVWFCCRGLGMTDEAIARHIDD